MDESTLDKAIQEQVRAALREDVGSGDVTAVLVPENRRAEAQVITRESAVLCGRAWFEAVFQSLDETIEINWQRDDGEMLSAGESVCNLRGPARGLLTGERCALNFLQLLSGTATVTRSYVDAVQGTGAQILDTRKTVPGLRLAQKYAVRCGGGRNHRSGLYDGVLIKENHILAAGGITAAVERARESAGGLSVEVEVEDLAQLREALVAGADEILLDNFSLQETRAAVAARDQLSSARLEASGGVDLGGIRAVAECGVDYISVGALTKHVRAVDLSMRFTLSA